MRSRNVKPGFFLNEELAELPFEARILFIGLWCYADREGRFEWRPKRIKVEIFPYDNVDVTNFLRYLTKKNFISQYRVDGCDYGVIQNFKKHQRPHNTEKPSDLPPPPENIPENNELENNVENSLSNVENSFDNALIPDSLIPDSLIPENTYTAPKFFGAFENVKLSEDEHKKLVEKFGEHDSALKIESLSSYIASKGKRYKSHYATILVWSQKDPPKLRAPSPVEKCFICGKVTGDLIDFKFCSFECRDRANGGTYAHDAGKG